MRTLLGVANKKSCEKGTELAKMLVLYCNNLYIVTKYVWQITKEKGKVQKDLRSVKQEQMVILLCCMLFSDKGRTECGQR